MNSTSLFHGLLAGNRLALAKAITLVENQNPGYEELMAKVYSKTFSSHVVGVTGSPGTGKSTVVFQIAKKYLGLKKSIGIVAVDPTSPFSGGAILGDRIRMTELGIGKDLFIRSMGSRGYPGGLARATNDTIKLMQAFGKDIILVETVGAGQSEVDIAKSAHTIIVVEIPGTGDDIQALKAGLFEIAHIFLVNKSDLSGSDRSVYELEKMISMKPCNPEEWKIPVVKTVAIKGNGMSDLVKVIQDHFRFIQENGSFDAFNINLRRQDFEKIVKDKLLAYVYKEIEKKDYLIMKELLTGAIDPYTAASKIVSQFSQDISNIQ